MQYHLRVKRDVVILKFGDNLVGFVDVISFVLDDSGLFSQMTTFPLDVILLLPLSSTPVNFT